MSKFREYLEGVKPEKEKPKKNQIIADWLIDYVTKDVYNELKELSNSGFSVINLKIGDTKILLSLNSEKIDSFNLFHEDTIRTSKKLEDFIKIGTVIQGLSKIIPFRKK